MPTAKLKSELAPACCASNPPPDMIPTVYHDQYRAYCFGEGHPFAPFRLQMLLELLEALGYPPDVTEPEAATREEVLAVHRAAFVEAVEAASAETPGPHAELFGLGTVDVPIFPGMDAAARRLVGGTLCAARMISSGAAPMVLQLGGGFHHAHHAKAAGFCVYNDLSATISHLTGAGLRVAYLDVDVHHGDGVQALHYTDADVLTVSLHESGQYLFPGTGDVGELGEAGGKGFKLNVPLEPGTDDKSYLDVFERVVPHALSWFAPDVLVVMCGADAHHADPLADLKLTTHAYETLFRRLLDLADEHTGGRALFTLGGGYDPDATVRVWALLYLTLNHLPLPKTLPASWRTRWEARLGRPLTPTLHDAEVPPLSLQAETIAQQNRETSKRLMETAVKHWY